MPRSARTPLGAYVAGCIAAGLSLLGWLVYWAATHHLVLRVAPILIMTVVLIVGEIRPIPVARGDEVGDEVSISSTLACAMMLITPLPIAVLAQGTALAIDEARSRRKWERLAFNVAQYALALTAARLVFSAASGAPFLDVRPVLHASELGPALLAMTAFFAVNDGATATAVGLMLRLPLIRHVLNDARTQLPTAGVLLALAPMAAEAVQWSYWALILLLLPLAAVHRSARLASAREHEALHDALTGLANRTLFLARLERACATVHRAPMAVMMLDLDHFKEINDTLGHHAGDLLIVEAARRLRAATRPGDLIARLGGDEFAVLAPGVASPRLATELALRLHNALDEQLAVGEVKLSVHASIGIVLAPEHGEDAESLLRRADVALYTAKVDRGSACLYQPERDEHSVERLTLVSELRRGLASGAITIHYQPKVSLVTGEVVGVEALARWQHPARGLLLPDRFIALAEGTGLMAALTLAVLDRSLQDLRELHAAGHLVSLAVNVSSRQLCDETFPETVAGLLVQNGIAPMFLILEVTEHALMSDTHTAQKTVGHLRQFGVRLAIDDFGTGYSSLAYLKRLQVDEIKIDRGFVSGIAHDEHDAAIVQATVELGHKFGLEVVAEGVEDEPTLRMLTSIGCDAAQGFLYARPLPLDTLHEWLGDHRARIARRPAVRGLGSAACS